MSKLIIDSFLDWHNIPKAMLETDPDGHRNIHYIIEEVMGNDTIYTHYFQLRISYVQSELEKLAEYKFGNDTKG